MGDSDQIDARILKLFDASPGDYRELAIREFADDIEAHTETLQERYAAEMASNFQAAITIVSKSYGSPTATLTWEDPAFDSWVEKLPTSFNQLVVWARDDNTFFYILNHHEDRELPLLILAGVTD